MRLVFYSPVLNHHQAGVADELYHILGDDYKFVELTQCNDTKGGKNYSERPYLIKSWQSKEAYDEAITLAKTAEVGVFAGCESLPFQKERLQLGLLSFDMGERLLKRGWLNLLSPRIFKLVCAYHINRWHRKPLYKLCCSAFTVSDCSKLRMFKNKCFKWGYFTAVDDNINLKDNADSPVSIMWCARLLTLKHPELVIEMARILKKKNLRVSIDLFGDDSNIGPNERVFSSEQLESLIHRHNLEGTVKLKGNKPNNEILLEMRNHDIFLFTSDKKEGWGAVANESLANGCALVASDAIGSSPYLIEDGVNGFMFESGNSKSLAEKVEWLILNRHELAAMKRQAHEIMKSYWTPKQAAINLLRLVNDIQNGRDTSIIIGPCSKA